MISFNAWMKEVNQLCNRIISVSTSDLEDYHWRDSYEDELKPGEALFDFLSENGYLNRYPELFSDYLDESEVY